MKIEDIEESPRVQVRAGKPDASTVQRYREAYEAGAIMPPIVVFNEEGTERYIVADGHHRLAAARAAGMKTIEVDLRHGDEADALKYALSCNAAHGLPRTKKDLAFSVRQLMSNAKLTDQYRTHRERGELLGVSERTFQRLIADWRESKPKSKAEAKAQEAAKASAEKHTPKATADKPPKKSEKPPLTDEQKKAAQQVRDSHKPLDLPKPPKPAASAPTWTVEDERTFLMLQDAWDAATPAARIQFLAEKRRAA